MGISSTESFRTSSFNQVSSCQPESAVRMREEIVVNCTIEWDVFVVCRILEIICSVSVPRKQAVAQQVYEKESRRSIY